MCRHGASTGSGWRADLRVVEEELDTLVIAVDVDAHVHAAAAAPRRY